METRQIHAFIAPGGSRISQLISRQPRMEMRLSAVIRKLGIASIADLVSQLRSSAVETLRPLVVEAMTTNETSFYRDVHPFEALKTQILPDVIKNRRTERTLPIWCAASSTGQEPYSIAMLLRDQFPELLGWKLYFLATDISEGVLSHAREGQFSQLEVCRLRS